MSGETTGGERVEALAKALLGPCAQMDDYTDAGQEQLRRRARRVIASEWLRDLIATERAHAAREALAPVLALVTEWDRARILNPSFGVATARATSQLRAATVGSQAARASVDDPIAARIVGMADGLALAIRDLRSELHRLNALDDRWAGIDWALTVLEGDGTPGGDS